MNYVIASTNTIYTDLPTKLAQTHSDHQFIFINNKDELTTDNLERIKPQYIFFPHWSFIISEQIYQNFECVIFHMTDLPYGRGGSPLQNLIVREISDTKISALKCQSGIDSGPIYCKYPLALHGSAYEIFLRAKEIIYEMISFIIENKPIPNEQTGTIVQFERRTPGQGNIGELEDIHTAYNFIRMLDAPGYPKAFLETGNMRLEFEQASLNNGCLSAQVKIFNKEQY